MSFPQTTLVDSLDDVNFSGLTLPMFVLYDHPKDFPDKIVLRVWDMDRPTNVAMVFDTLEDARAHIPLHLIRIVRAEADDPVIVETYM